MVYATLLLLLASCACNEELARLETVPVEGRVTYQGETVQGAKVVLHPTSRIDVPVKLWGVSNGWGRYDVKAEYAGAVNDYGDMFSFKGGAPPGSYIVTIETTTTTRQRGKALRLPDRLADPSRSGIRMIVDRSGAGPYDIDL